MTKKKNNNMRRATSHSTPPTAIRMRGPNVTGCSNDSRRIAAVLLEVLAGMRTPAQAATALNVSTPRYYSLELQALEGLVLACEPKQKGPGRSPQKLIEKQETQIHRLESEISRQRALIRSAQRAIGITTPTLGKQKKGKRQQRKPSIRALKVVSVLRSDETIGSNTSA